MKRCLMLVLAAAAAACTEPQSGESPAPRPSAMLEPHVDVSTKSPAAGSTVIVTVRFTGPSIASTTARLVFDSTAFVFASEDSLSDGATRVLNPTGGLVRFAAVSPRGFGIAPVYVMRFTARRAAVADFRLTVDEAHTISGSDARATMAGATP